MPPLLCRVQHIHLNYVQHGPISADSDVDSPLRIDAREGKVYDIDPPSRSKKNVLRTILAVLSFEGDRFEVALLQDAVPEATASSSSPPPARFQRFPSFLM